MPHVAETVTSVIVIRMMSSAEERQVLEIRCSTCCPRMEVVDIAFDPRAVTAGMGAYQLRGRQGYLLIKACAALAAAQFQREFLIINHTDEIV